MCSIFIFHAWFTSLFHFSSFSHFFFHCSTSVCIEDLIHLPGTCRTSSLPQTSRASTGKNTPTITASPRQQQMYAIHYTFILVTSNDLHPDSLSLYFQFLTEAHDCIQVINIFFVLCWSKHIHFIRITMSLYANEHERERETYMCNVYVCVYPADTCRQRLRPVYVSLNMNTSRLFFLPRICSHMCFNVLHTVAHSSNCFTLGENHNIYISWQRSSIHSISSFLVVFAS